MFKKRHFTPIVVALALVVAAVPALAGDANEEFDALNAKWVQAFKDNDMAVIAALMTPDSLLLAPNAPPIKGTQAIVDTWMAWRELPNVEITFGATFVDVAASGDLAYDYGAYSFAFDSEEGRVVDEGKYIVVWKKVDGAWKVMADIFNGNGAPK